MNEDAFVLVSQVFWLAFLISLIMALLVLRSVLHSRRLAREKSRLKDTAPTGTGEGTPPSP